MKMSSLPWFPILQASLDAAVQRKSAPHHGKPQPQETGAKQPWGESSRLGKKALPEKNRENGLRIGKATGAYADAASRRSNAGRIFANRWTGARRASNAMWHGARRDHSVTRSAP